MDIFKNNTDREWEAYGETDPYFGVITDERFRKSNLSEENKKAFFDSGHDEIERILIQIRRHIDPTFAIKEGLDFGCGVGRLLIPIAAHAEAVTGIDISDAMLNEAKGNCEARGIKNACFVVSDDALTQVSGRFNFIHSYIVFQHIPVKRGERIFKQLLGHLESEGVGVVHFTYAKEPVKRGMLGLIKTYIPLARNVLNVMNGQPFFSPKMQMNPYELKRIFSLIQEAKVKDCYTEFTNHGGHLGLVIYFKKP